MQQDEEQVGLFVSHVKMPCGLHCIMPELFLAACHQSNVRVPFKKGIILKLSRQRAPLGSFCTSMHLTSVQLHLEVVFSALWPDVCT